MAIAVREVLAIPNGSTTQQVVTSGAGTQAGDTFLVIQCTDNTTVADPTSTAGTLTQHGTTETDGNGNGQVKAWKTDAVSGGAKTVTFPAAGGFDILGVVLVLAGTATLDGFNKTHFTSSGTSFATPTATLTNTNDLFTVVCYLPGNTTFDFTGSGLTQQAQCTALPFSAMAVATANLVSSGTSPSYTVTTGAGVKAGMLVFGATAAVTTVNGTGTGSLGTLTGSAVGTPTVVATAGKTFGTLAGTGVGLRTVLATAGKSLGPTGSAVGVRATSGSGLGNLGALTGSGRVTSTAPVTGSGWGSLYALNAEFRQFARDEATRQPVACPNDGEPLRTGPDGQLYCKYDGWRPSR